MYDLGRATRGGAMPNSLGGASTLAPPGVTRDDQATMRASFGSDGGADGGSGSDLGGL